MKNQGGEYQKLHSDYQFALFSKYPVPWGGDFYFWVFEVRVMDQFIAGSRTGSVGKGEKTAPVRQIRLAGDIRSRTSEKSGYAIVVAAGWNSIT